jgi:ParB-like chromosome segregation protein Spo0J
MATLSPTMNEAAEDTREWIAGCPIHPAASLLPLIEEEELEAMAEDIREHGLRLPILTNAAGEVVDGRNRLLACEKAGVKPLFAPINGVDTFDSVISLNLQRRHLNSNQRAMLHAYLRYQKKQQRSVTPEVVFETVKEMAERLKISQNRLYQCNQIIKHAPQLVFEVIQARMTVDDAYEEAKPISEAPERRRAMEVLLQDKAPDLWHLVVDGSMKLPDAVRSLEAREREEAAHAFSLAKNMSQGFRLLDPGSFDIEEQARHWLTVNPALLDDAPDFSASRARRIAHALHRYAELKEEADEA